MDNTYNYEAPIHDDFALPSFSSSSFNDAADVGLLEENWTDPEHSSAKGSISFPFEFESDPVFGGLNPTFEEDASHTDRDSLEPEVYSNPTEDSDSGDDITLFPSPDSLFHQKHPSLDNFMAHSHQGYGLDQSTRPVQFRGERYNTNSLPSFGFPNSNTDAAFNSAPNNMQYWDLGTQTPYTEQDNLSPMSEKALLRSKFDMRLTNVATAPILKSSRTTSASTPVRAPMVNSRAKTSARKTKSPATKKVSSSKKRQRVVSKSTPGTKKTKTYSSGKASSVPYASLMNQSSAFRGVSCCGRDRKWQARIRDKELNRVKYLGRFVSQIEAAFEYDKFARTCKGHAALTNFAELTVEQSEQLVKAYDKLGYLPQEYFHLLGDGMEARMRAVQERALNASKDNNSKTDAAPSVKRQVKKSIGNAQTKKRKKAPVARAVRSIDTTTPPPGVELKLKYVTPRETQVASMTAQKTLSPSVKKTKVFEFPSPSKTCPAEAKPKVVSVSLQRQMFTA